MGQKDEALELRDRKQRLRQAAESFAEKLRSLETVGEVALCGSMVAPDPYPNDIDLAIVISSNIELPLIARAARQMSSFYHSWEVFVFAPEKKYLGRICHRRDCPSPFHCEYEDCGKAPFLGNLASFRFNPKTFLSPEIEVLWQRAEKSVLLGWRDELGIKHPPLIKPLVPIRLICKDCGRRFVFSVAEQKIYKKRDFTPPKRCSFCRMRRIQRGY